MPDDLTEKIEQGKVILDELRAKRLADITEGDIQVDPALLELGDEVADEIVSDFKKFHTMRAESTRLIDSEPKFYRGEQRFTPEQRRNAAQRATDLAMEMDISYPKAAALVGEEVGAARDTVISWGKRYGIDSPTLPRAESPRGSWPIQRRQRLLEEIFDNLDLANKRWNAIMTGQLQAPEGWKPAAELKDIQLTAAIGHDKLTGIEDILVARGIRDVDSEELQGELSAGRQRLLEMGQ